MTGLNLTPRDWTAPQGMVTCSGSLQPRFSDPCVRQSHLEGLGGPRFLGHTHRDYILAV